MAKLFKVIRWLGALAVAGVVWEGAARLDDYVAYDAALLEPYNPDILYTNDALGKVGKPHGRYVKWRFNALGYRSPELDRGRVRIVTMGASETFGLYESENGEYPRRLETEINARAKRAAYQVINVSYPGLSNTGLVRRLPVILAGVQPRVAVIYPSLANYIYLPVNPNAIPRAEPVSPYESRMGGKVWKVLKDVLPQWAQSELRNFQIEKETRGMKLLERLPDENVAVFRRELVALVDGLQARGVKVLLVTHATRFGDRVTPEERPMLIAWRKFYPKLQERAFLDMEARLNEVIRQEAAARAIGLADVARQMPPGPRYFADFVHFTDEGARVMAGILANQLQPILAGLPPE